MLDGDHIVIAIKLNKDSPYISSHALVDCARGTSYAFMDEEFAQKHKFPLLKLKTPRALKVIDGRPIVSGMITHITKVFLDINSHREEAPMFIIQLSYYPVIIGLPWLRRHDVHIGFIQNTLYFDSDFCLEHCCENAIYIKGLSVPVPVKEVTILLPTPKIAIVAGSTYTRALKKKKRIIATFSMTIYQIDKALKKF